jgi:hypothetical protein
LLLYEKNAHLKGLIRSSFSLRLHLPGFQRIGTDIDFAIMATVGL